MGPVDHHRRRLRRLHGRHCRRRLRVGLHAKVASEVEYQKIAWNIKTQILSPRPAEDQGRIDLPPPLAQKPGRPESSWASDEGQGAPLDLKSPLPLTEPQPSESRQGLMFLGSYFYADIIFTKSS